MQFLKICIEAESVIQYVFISSVEFDHIDWDGKLKALNIKCPFYFK